jgi:hypothetical protein
LAGAVAVLAGCAPDNRVRNPFIVDPPPEAPRPLNAEQAAKMSDFLARWGRSVGASYKHPAAAGDCTPVVSGLLFYGQLANIRAVKSCGPALDDPLIMAIESAGRPKIPEALAGRLEGRWVGVRFYDRSIGSETASVAVALSTERPPAAQQQESPAPEPVGPR